MNNLQRYLAWASIGLVFTSLACSSQPPAATGYATPEECLAAARSALDAQDFQKYVNCLTAESQTDLAAILLHHSLVAQGMEESADPATHESESIKKMKLLIKDMHVVLSAHKIDVASLPSAATLAARTEIAVHPVVEQRAETITDKPAFIAQMFSALTKTGSFNAKHFERLDGTTGEVVVEGDRAAIETEIASRKPPEKGFLNFTKASGAWLLTRNGID